MKICSLWTPWKQIVQRYIHIVNYLIGILLKQT